MEKILKIIVGFCIIFLLVSFINKYDIRSFSDIKGFFGIEQKETIQKEVGNINVITPSDSEMAKENKRKKEQEKIDKSNKEWEEMDRTVNEIVNQSDMTIKFNRNPIFSTWKAPATLAFTNVGSNLYPQVLEMYLADTGELLYKSEPLPVGKVIQDITINKELGKGDYLCEVKVYQIDAETEEVLSQANTVITITVLFDAT